MQLDDFEFVVKPTLTAGMVAVGSKMFINPYKSWKHSIWGGAAVGAGVLLADTIYENFLVNHEEARNMGDAIVSTGFGTVSGLGADVLLSGGKFPDNMGSKTALIMGSIVASNAVEGLILEEG